MADAGRTRRPLAVVALAAVLGAIAMAAAAGLTWWSQPFDDSLTGRVDATASGAATLPELVPVALVVLAGLGATLATRGPARRLVGGLLLLAGLLVAVRAVAALSTPPAALAGQLVRPATAADAATGHPFGPLLAALGALAVVVAGLLVVLGRGAGRRRTLGARYERRRPGDTAAAVVPADDRQPLATPALAVDGAADAADSETNTSSNTSSNTYTDTPRDPGAARADIVDSEARTVDWWNQLDSGGDPTAGAPPDRAGRQSSDGHPESA